LIYQVKNRSGRTADLSVVRRIAEFVSQFSREYFISRKTMENQAAYTERTRGLKAADEEIWAEDMQVCF
jgi:hypothetical protein